MSVFNDPGTIAIISILVIYGVLTLYNSFLKSHNSIKDSERIHRFMLIASGLIIGGALGKLDIIFSTEKIFISVDFYFGLLSLIIGVFLIAVAKFYLHSTFYGPLEGISEFSAEFGTSFVGTRLPITGVIELQSFSSRFNNNILTLANRLSKSEIQLNKLKNGISSSIDSFRNYSSDMNELTGLVLRSNSIVNTFSGNLTSMETMSKDFISWYELNKESFTSILIDLRSLTDVGNLIAVNAAIESVNMEVENAGFTAIASKLHDLAKNLEEKNDNLQRIFIDMNNRFSEYNLHISQIMETSVKLLGDSGENSSRIEGILYTIKTYDRDIMTNNDANRLIITSTIEDLPTSF